MSTVQLNASKTRVAIRKIAIETVTHFLQAAMTTQTHEEAGT